MLPLRNHDNNNGDAEIVLINNVNNDEIRIIRLLFVAYINNCRESIESLLGNLKSRFRLLFR